MFKNLYPFEYVENVFLIDYQSLYNKGYRGLIFDIDNTLVPHGKDATKDVEDLFKKIKSLGFRTLLLSNNNEERVKRFINNIDTLYICDANKPNVYNYLNAVKMLNIDKKQALFIGDQIFTDIYGANKSGIDNILVKYIGFYEKGKKGIKRNLEKLILKMYNYSKYYKNRIGNVEKEEAFK